jgi:hypothetical protein
MLEYHTRVSPLSLVRFGGSPAGRACSKVATSPFLAASYILLAKSIISGVRDAARSGWFDPSLMMVWMWCLLVRM